MGAYADRGPRRRPPTRARRVCLRDTRRPEGSRLRLDAELTPSGDLRLRGHDEGPVAERINPEGDYRYLHHVPAGAVGELLVHLGHGPDADALTVLASHWSDAASYRLEELVQSFPGPHAFSTWE
ncbi:hypothetical protein [Nocardioides insulae]|uniref:hypothetical protein n=1 Tax=Nocardioides insulae TaxID=394734 RepID=UPI00049022A4|nr:hypothetical protein [Nocardioides insulae]